MRVKLNKINQLEKFGYTKNNNYPNYHKDIFYSPAYSDTITVSANTGLIERTVCPIDGGTKTFTKIPTKSIQDLINNGMVE